MSKGKSSGNFWAFVLFVVVIGFYVYGMVKGSHSKLEKQINEIREEIKEIKGSYNNGISYNDGCLINEENGEDKTNKSEVIMTAGLGFLVDGGYRSRG